MRLPNGYGGVSKLSGNRRKPWLARKTTGWDDNGKQIFKNIGSYKTRVEALKALTEFNDNPYDLENRLTFSQVYEDWSIRKYKEVGGSSVRAHISAYKSLSVLHERLMSDLRLKDLQNAVDDLKKNYPMRKKLKVLINQLYDYSMKNDIIQKDYSKFIELGKKEVTEGRKPFNDAEVAKLFANQAHNEYLDIIIMLIYNGCRISELLDLKKVNIDMERQCFDVIDSKTENGIRTVPIATRLVPLYEKWMKKDCEYLLCTPDNEHFLYRNYYDSYWTPFMEELDMKHTPHDTRHTAASKLSAAKVDQTRIKKILGHAGAMTLTERVYTHFEIKELIEAVDMII